MSTESGLPDFRSAGGLWRQNRRFEELASVTALQQWPEEFDEFYRYRMQELERHAPHLGHLALAALQRQGHVRALITQNVDGFHERAGSPGVLCLHGSLRQVRCHRCGRGHARDRYLTGLGRCDCGGKLRPSVVLFGEALAPSVLEAAFAAAADADLFVVLGSSLSVAPANSLPEVALRNGARLVLINRESTPFATKAFLDIRAQLGPTLSAVAERLGLTV
jgi:NAD-dependent deacetylase